MSLFRYAFFHARATRHRLLAPGTPEPPPAGHPWSPDSTGERLCAIDTPSPLTPRGSSRTLQCARLIGLITLFTGHTHSSLDNLNVRVDTLYIYNCCG